MKPIHVLVLAIMFAIAAVGGRWNSRRPLHRPTPAGVSIPELSRDRWGR